ncbi:Lactose permease [Cyphellophora attinorum]|uniref:Lactose permease n=1 Tax=Cyphellophora attinorum TaxID=1664694 RepID=A0A0N1HJ00_9EURO|nr:Lactose permease [Phialophora attinorum]KPI36256.1 Lactose permease [Phialophora attinorum]
MKGLSFRTGAIGVWQPKSSNVTNLLLIISACVFATTQGYDSALMTGLNIMPRYTQDLELVTATISLNSGGTLVGWGIASFCMGPVVDKVGRKSGIVVSIVIKTIGIILMTAAIHEAMFILGRIILGFGSATAAIASSAWLAETLPISIRGRGLSIIYCVYYVGALTAAGVTYGTANYDSSWCWRLPCALQAIFALLCWCVLWCTPESPRWLAHKDRTEEALLALASTHSNGDRNDPVVLAQHREILDTLQFERDSGQKTTYKQLFKTRNSRKRVMLVMSVAIIAMMSGNNIIAYYLGSMLNAAGITNTTTQLQINIILNAWSFLCSIVGTYYMDKLGRKTLCLFACSSMTVLLFVVGALTKVYGESINTSGIYGTVAAIFLFQGAYSVGITPLTQLYPPEVLNYAIRSNGMAVWTLSAACFGLFSAYIPPFALAAIGWKFYMINGAYDVLQVIYVAIYWVETKGLSLEQIDRLIDGEKHSDVPDAIVHGVAIDSQRRSEELGQEKKSEIIKVTSASA